MRKKGAGRALLLVAPGDAGTAAHTVPDVRQFENHVQGCIDRVKFRCLYEDASGAGVDGELPQHFVLSGTVGDGELYGHAGGRPTLEVQELPCRLDEVEAVYGFENDSIAAGLAAAQEILLVSLVGEHHDGCRPQGLVVLDEAAAFVSIHEGHVQVEKNEIRLLLPDDLEGLCSVAGDEELDFDTPEKGLFQFDENVVTSEPV